MDPSINEVLGRQQHPPRKREIFGDLGEIIYGALALAALLAVTVSMALSVVGS